MTTPVIEARNLCCERDERILFYNLNLRVCAGDIVQIAGPNGSGKTTLLRILTTVSHDFSGRLYWGEDDLRRRRLDYLNHLLYLGHQPSVKKALSPRENLRWFSGLSSGHVQMPIEQALREVGLHGYEDVPCYALSAGQLRRVALARLYQTPARIWVLDEPFTAIDKQGVAALERLLLEHASGGGSVVLTTHQELGLAGVRRLDLLDFQADSDAMMAAAGDFS
ncbi:cytochrome c biogenesis heme-transporting ATPase CcmA [Exilibacterium tricleocarpae]|uniref:Cytochrome c biogenesis heme-transporting ATPase CcmA n=1 Tax=Exilibacterium tricleocarpae TaxID=2591008 RepID=A0A545TM25_9GAMM|nr:cytochrome c biogenesis heme-transporting ATPase CcmA [Exilibacterium tricleocarpae]